MESSNESCKIYNFRFKYELYIATSNSIVYFKDKSENRTENNISTKMFINEKEIELKNNMFIEISEMYSLNEDKSSLQSH